MKYYRFVSDKYGIYAAADRDCPRTDPRRNNKPDGSWLEKAGTKFPGAISFWTEEGLKQYIESGLQEWHASVVKDPVFVQVARDPGDILYSDPHQIICLPKEIRVAGIIKLDSFLR